MSQEIGGAESEAFIIFWRLLLMTAVVVFILFTVGVTFSAKQDIRDAEAAMVSDKIMNCISEKGIIKSDFNLDNCIKEGGYYINASLISFDSGFSREVIKGNSLVEVNCKLIENGAEMKQYPSCLKQVYYVLIDNAGKTEKGKLELMIGVEKYAENLKL
jgi:hypothetical protein